jgi:hypothetical protein
MCRPLIDDAIDDIPVILSFLGFQVGPGQSQVQMIHTGEIEEIAIVTKEVFAQAVVIVVVVPTFVGIGQSSLVVPVWSHINNPA